MDKKMAVTCDCENCRALAEHHGFEIRNWFCDFARPTDFAILPARPELDADTKKFLCSVFAVPDHFEPHEFPVVLENCEQAFSYKFADTKEGYQAAELVVRQYNGYYYCRMARYDKWYAGVEDHFQFIEWDFRREQELPPHLTWIVCLSMDRAHLGVRDLFRQRMKWRTQGPRDAVREMVTDRVGGTLKRLVSAPGAKS